MVDTPDPVALERLELPADLAATLVLIRHGESTWVAEGRFQGRQDPPLSALGQRQAAMVANRLAHRDERTPLPIPTNPPAGIWHSPLSRAAETARIVANRQPADVSVVALEALTEIAQGDWEGALLSEVRTRWAAELQAWRRMPARAHAPGGEPLVAAAQRVRSGLAEIIASLAAPRVAGAGSAVPYDPVPGYVADGSAINIEPWALVIAHDGIFRLALINLLGLPLERFWSFPFNLAAITVVTVHEGVAALRAHNLSDHQAPLAVEDRAAQESRGDRRGAL